MQHNGYISIAIRGAIPVKAVKKIFRKQTVIAALVILVMMVGLGYFAIQHAENQVKESFMEAIRPLQTACHEPEGCFLIPELWIERSCPANGDLPGAKLCASPPQTSAYHGLIYRATADEFVARWRYVADTELVAYGGRGQILRVQEIKLE